MKNTNMKTEMKKIMHRRISHSKVLPLAWTESVVAYSDLAGNTFRVPRICVYLENGEYEELVAYNDELVLNDKDGEIGGWVIENGQIRW